MRLPGALALACALAAAAHAETRPTYGGDVIGSLLGEPATLDPPSVRSQAETALVGLIFDTLYRTRVDGTVVPQLALGMPEVTGQTVKIRVRAAEVHGGGTLGAADAAASLERLRAGPAAWILAGITEVAADGDLVVLTLAHPIDELAARLSLPQTAITPLNRPGTPNVATGSGPFELVQVDRKARKVVLRAFERYFDGRPYVRQLELAWFTDPGAEVRRFETGGAHTSLRGAVTFVGQGHKPKYKSGDVEGQDSLLIYLGFGRAHATAMANRDLRRALSLALPRQQFQVIGSGERVTAAGGPVPKDLGGPVATQRELLGDVTEAIAALRSAQAKIPALAAARLPQLKLEILVVASHPDDRDVADRVVGALDALGIPSTVTAVGAIDFATRIATGQCDLYIGQLPVATADPGLLWAAAFEAGGDTWARTALDKGSIDPATAAKELVARLPIIPLYHRQIKLAHRSDLRNLTLDIAGGIGFVDAAFFGAPEKP